MDKAEKKQRAKPFIAVRAQHHLESAEDYTELVGQLIETKGEARTCDIAEHMGISHVTALRTIRRLQAEGYLETEPHKPVTLTKKGELLAKTAKSRHDLLMRYLLALGVSEEVAASDVEGMEHHVSPETLDALERHLDKLER